MEKSNISEQRASITWTQFLVAIFFVAQFVFWVTNIYKDIQFEVEKNKLNKEYTTEIKTLLQAQIDASNERTNRVVRHADEKNRLNQEISHLNLTIQQMKINYEQDLREAYEDIEECKER